MVCHVVYCSFGSEQFSSRLVHQVATQGYDAELDRTIL